RKPKGASQARRSQRSPIAGLRSARHGDTRRDDAYRECIRRAPYSCVRVRDLSDREPTYPCHPLHLLLEPQSCSFSPLGNECGTRGAASACDQTTSCGACGRLWCSKRARVVPDRAPCEKLSRIGVVTS